MSPFAQKIIGSFIQWALTIAATWLVAHGVWEEGDVTGYVAGGTTAILTLIWTLWQRYQGRVWFLTALHSPANTTEAAVTAKVEKGAGAKVLTLVLAVAIGTMSMAGCGPTTKPVLIKTDTAVYESVRAIHETAKTLGDANVITVAQEIRIQSALLPVSRIGERITAVIVAWKSGPTPPELQQLIKELGALVTEVGNALPDGPGKSALLEKITLAQQAVLVVIVIMSGGTS